MSTATEDRKDLCDVTKVKVGDKWSRQSYGTVISAPAGGGMEVENEGGLKWTIDENLFKEEFRVAGQFEETEQKTKTELAELCMENPRVVMVICFIKQVDPNELADNLLEHIREEIIQKAVANSSVPTLPSQRSWRSTIRGKMKSGERILTGRHTCSKDAGGRLYFTDMEVTEGSNVRLVDPRTIQWMIVDGVKYVLKK